MGGADRTIVILSNSRVRGFKGARVLYTKEGELYTVCFNAYIVSILILYNYTLCFSQLCSSLA